MCRLQRVIGVYLILCFSIECRKTKTQVITTVLIRRKENILKNSWPLKVKPTKLNKARDLAGDQVVIGFSLHLIGWESGASFLGQLQSEVNQNKKQSRITFDTLYYPTNIFRGKKETEQLNNRPLIPATEWRYSFIIRTDQNGAR